MFLFLSLFLVFFLRLLFVGSGVLVPVLVIVLAVWW